MIGGSTRLFVLLGRPVAHSLSPAMQNAAFGALGLDAVYAALDCPPGETDPCSLGMTYRLPSALPANISI